MSDLALYRKYRSQSFQDVIGQEHVIGTLSAAIANGRISHAYLFTGPRGVGKTSVARLLARSLNCTGKSKPCGECDNCKVEIGSHLDLIEIDAASNRRIDEIRDLRDKINLAPSMGEYKVYIIDEVHMLTTEAFNALLKTLEEPPAHAVFILATTEAHKLPATIVSRTQRFNFRAINRADLTRHLGSIAEAEKIDISPAAIEILAEASGGSFRDGISLLDQVANSSKGAISAELVRHVLGWSHEEEISALSRAIAAKDARTALEVLDRVLAGGSQAGQINAQLLAYHRRLMHASIGLNEPTPEMQPILQLSTTSDIVAIIQALAALNTASLPQVALEATLVQLAAKIGRPAPSAVTPELSTAAPSKPHPVSLPTAAQAKPVAPRSSSTSKGLNPALWPKALLLIKARNNSLYALLQSCSCEIGEDQVTITCRFNFHRQRLQEEKNFTIIESALAKTYGKKVKLKTTLESSATSGQIDNSAELVSSALDILGGEVVE